MLDINNKINRMLGGTSTSRKKGEWFNKGKKFYVYEWHNPKINKTLVIQKETSGKYAVEVYSGGGRMMSFNKFLGDKLTIDKAKNIANEWMKKNR